MVIRLSGTLLRFADYQKEVRVDAPTLKEGISHLGTQYPDVGKALFDKLGQLRASHRLFVNGDLVGKADMGRSVGGDDIVDIVTAVTGG
ncbi:MAG TPA: MoaD/ThiS family protein [Myxococcaceae bacterium]|jgi:sulfur carrier protein ThiS